MDVEVKMRCVVLSLASSLDNFAVGVSLGMYGRPLSMRVNIIVSACNAVGALLSSQIGVLLGQQAPDVAALLGAIIFVWLGYSEADSYRLDEASPLTNLAEAGVAWRLAVPMTLNNVAGGVAGGLAKVRSVDMFFGALVASFGLMFFGHLFGKYGSKLVNSIDPRLVGALAFTFLGTSQLADLVGWPTSIVMVPVGFVLWTKLGSMMASDTPERKPDTKDIAPLAEQFYSPLPRARLPNARYGDRWARSHWETDPGVRAPGAHSRLRARRLFKPPPLRAAKRCDSDGLNDEPVTAFGALFCCSSR